MKIQILKFKKKQEAFTLIELIVVIAIFMFVVGAAVGIFISIFQRQKMVLSEQELLNQVSYAEEYVSKALRMARTAVTSSDLDCLGAGNSGYIYLLTRYDSGTGVYRGIKFINQSGLDSNGNPVCEEFFVDRADPNNLQSPLVLKELKNNNPDAQAVALTSAGVELDNSNPIRFAIDGLDGSSGPNCPNPPTQCGASWADSAQPRVTMLLNVKVLGEGTTTRTIQTTISQRNLNINNDYR